MHAVLVGLGAAVLTTIASWVPSYWNDEAATLRLARLPFDHLLDFLQHKDAVHGVYAMIMHVWIGGFGESELAVRAPSVLAVAFAAAGVYRLGCELASSRAAWFATVLFVVLPRVTFNGLEARSYALTTALIVWAAYWTVRAAVDGGWWRWLIVVALGGLATATFLYAALVFPSFVVLAWSVGTRRRWAAVAAIAASVLAVVVASPVAVVAAGEGSQIAWLRSQPVNAYTVLVETFFLQAWWMAALALILCICAAVRLRIRRPGKLATVAFVWVLFPLVALLIGSAVATPMFTPRYLSMTTPVVAIVLGAAVASWQRSTSIGIAIALVLSAAPTFVSTRTVEGKPGGQDLRGTAEVIASSSVPGDGFYLDNHGTVSLRPRITLAAYPSAFSRLRDVALDRPYYETGSYSDSLVDDATALRRSAQLRRVWVVVPQDSTAPFVGALKKRGWTIDGRWTEATVNISLMVAPQP